MATQTTTDAVQVCGGYGYTREYPAEKMMHHAQLNRALYGGERGHLMTVAKDFRSCLCGHKIMRSDQA
ncbi:MAG: hypothetical protein ISS61_10475 [Desulfobacteraceae bacterium]|nr:hypothetical protein [Desulfobacteraceae bacterium]